MTETIKRFSKRRLKWLIPLSLLLVFFVGGWSLQNKLAADRKGKWVAVNHDDLILGVEVTGSLSAVQSEVLGPPQINDMWNFKISMMAPEGTDVTEGRPVLSFDSTELVRKLEEFTAEADAAKTEIDKMRANLSLLLEEEQLRLAEARSRLRKADMKLEAPAELVGAHERQQSQLDHDLSVEEIKHLTSKIASLERLASAEIGLLDSKRLRAESKVSEFQQNIARMTVKAPRNGTVIYVTNWRSEKKKVGDSCWRAEKVIEIPDLRFMIGKGEVDEVDAGKVAVGQRVTFKLDAHPDDEIHGTITTIGRTVQQQSPRTPLKILRVEIKLDRTDAEKIRPGMRFRGTVELDRVKNALVIPRDAVFITAAGPVAYRRGTFSTSAVALKLGRRNEDVVEVFSGLDRGDRVLVRREQPEEPRS